jgi:RNA polymerase sigma-70 factor (ECF subfamily)
MPLWDSWMRGRNKDPLPPTSGIEESSIEETEISFQPPDIDTLEPDDQALIEKARLGDESAFELLVERYQWMVFRVALKIVHDTDDAADITQDTFFAAWKSLPGYRSEASLGTWLHTIAYHRSLRVLSQKRNRMTGLTQFASDQMSRLANAWSTMQAHMAEQQWMQTIYEQIESLPAKYRNILTLRHIQEQSYEEISKTLAISINNVKTQLFRARAMLRERIQGLEGMAHYRSSVLGGQLQEVADIARQQGEIFEEYMQDLASDVEDSVASLYIQTSSDEESLPEDE